MLISLRIFVFFEQDKDNFLDTKYYISYQNFSVLHKFIHSNFQRQIHLEFLVLLAFLPYSLKFNQNSFCVYPKIPSIIFFVLQDFHNFKKE